MNLNENKRPNKYLGRNFQHFSSSFHAMWPSDIKSPLHFNYTVLNRKLKSTVISCTVVVSESNKTPNGEKMDSGSHCSWSQQPNHQTQLSFCFFWRAASHNLLYWRRHPATRCTVGRWCQSCCLSAITFRTSPTEWTLCTASASTTHKGTSSLHTPASFCPQDTTVRTSCLSSMGGEEWWETLLLLLHCSPWCIIL